MFVIDVGPLINKPVCYFITHNRCFKFIRDILGRKVLRFVWLVT